MLSLPEAPEVDESADGTGMERRDRPRERGRVVLDEWVE